MSELYNLDGSIFVQLEGTREAMMVRKEIIKMEYSYQNKDLDLLKRLKCKIKLTYYVK